MIRPPELILASANAHKVEEIEAIFRQAELDIVLLPRPKSVPDIDETESTLEGNARLKARALVAATNRPALADDTGLEVDALGGLPGVHSARYAGEPADAERNVTKLLEELSEVFDPQRTARFRTVLMVLWPDGSELTVSGELGGTVAWERRGSNGFGYDPVFIPVGQNRTLAELSPLEKNLSSHRALAVMNLIETLSKLPLSIPK